MNQLAPEGPVYQAGTLSGNPLAVAAGIATLGELRKKDFYKNLNAKCLEFFETIDSWIDRTGAPVTLNRIGSLFTIFFTQNGDSPLRGQSPGVGRVFDETSAKTSDTKKYARFFHALLKQRIYFAPSQFEANFISQAMSVSELKQAAVTMIKILGTVLSAYAEDSGLARGCPPKSAADSSGQIRQSFVAKMRWTDPPKLCR